MINHLFKNGIIVTVNPDREIFFHGAVAVKDDRIVEVGPTEAMEAKYTDCERVTDLEGRVMFPPTTICSRPCFGDWEMIWC